MVETEIVLDEVMPLPRRQVHLETSDSIEPTAWRKAILNDVSGYRIAIIKASFQPLESFVHRRSNSRQDKIGLWLHLEKRQAKIELRW